MDSELDELISKHGGLNLNKDQYSTLVSMIVQIPYLYANEILNFLEETKAQNQQRKIENIENFAEENFKSKN